MKWHNSFTMSLANPTLGCPLAALKRPRLSSLAQGQRRQTDCPPICETVVDCLWMWVTEFADYGVLQLFNCLEIVGMDVFIEEALKEEVQGTDIG